MTTCQIAFVFKNRVFCLQEFSSNTRNVFQQMKAAAMKNLSADNGQEGTDIVLETMSAGSHVTITSDQDAVKYIFGCAVDGRAKIRVKFAKKPKAIKKPRALREKHSGLAEYESKSDTALEMPASTFVDQTFIRKVIELLDLWADVEISYEDTRALIDALKDAIVERDSLMSLIQTLVHLIDANHEHKWTIPQVLSDRFDSWIYQASEEELLHIAEQVPTVLDKLVSRRGKLFEDVFIKQKSAKQILKIRLPKSQKRERRLHHNQVVVEHSQHMRKNDADESSTSRGLDLKQLQPPVYKQDAGKHEIQVSLQAKKEELDILPSIDVENDSKKWQERQARFDKKLEMSGCKSVEELHVWSAVNKELKRGRAMAMYGCSTEQELKQAKKEVRLARQLARYGCQDENELRQTKLAKKLEKYGCKTSEELNQELANLRNQRRASKLKPT